MEAINHDAVHKSGDECGADASDEHDEDEYFAGEKESVLQAAEIHDLPGLPAGVKFDPTDQEILEHLEAKVRFDIHKLHLLIVEFIPTLEGKDGICSTHPEKLPG
ncbi:hypothetical protein DEO72_LG8g1497 [Vigna unguiculata]|uniref:NAC domain-containing protein n=1 Tax=Vigna unguiculata TaxID=3917 RepID=A0A4D6MPY9_VIGUN|nr:hypothetical protein DEO72_LG8g1497 [Vigna unguiculata]